MPVNNPGLFDYATLESELDVECAIELGRSFLEDTSPLMTRMSEALAAKDKELMRSTAHKLKGACRSINALKVEEASSALEDAARAGDEAGMAAHFKTLEPLYAALTDEIAAYLKSK
jgi:HPt (histidine-containing phosphotransfer) domain-containing protein